MHQLHLLQSSSLILLLSLWTPRSFSFIPSSRSARRQASDDDDTHQHHATTTFQPTTSEVECAKFLGNDIGEDLRQQQKDQELCIDGDNEGIVAALFGSADRRDDFFANTFGSKVAYFPANEQRLLEPPIYGIDLPSLYETNEWTSLRKRGSQDLLDKSQMSYDDLTNYIADGGSIIIPITPDDYLFPIKVQIEHAFGVEEETGTSMNIYHSGPSAVALNIHYDAYPVFVLQLEGQKEWLIQNDAFGMPLSEVTECQDVWVNITMMDGDLLYIPKGVFHAATTANGYETTTHATIGLL